MDRTGCREHSGKRPKVNEPQCDKLIQLLIFWLPRRAGQRFGARSRGVGRASWKGSRAYPGSPLP